MTEKTLSFIVPAHHSGSALVRRFLVSLTHQTANPEQFEVVIGADGGDSGALALAAKGLPFAVRVVDAPRPKGDLPHRNHARNAALRAAAGDYCWVVDADFLWDSGAVAHCLAVMESARARGELLAITPVLMRIEEDPDVWLGLTSGWAEGAETQTTAEVLSKVRVAGGVYSGFERKFKAGPPATANDLGLIPEGFPCAPIAVFKALGCFDERYIGWGGNKEELCRRLGALRNDGLRYRLLTSVRAYHQPHAQDSQKNDHNPTRLRNQQMFKRQMGEMGSMATWWSAQRDRIKKASTRARRILSQDAAPERQAAARRRPERQVVGLVTFADKSKGIARDMELLRDCLTGGAVRPGGNPDPRVDAFEIGDIARFRDNPLQARDTQGRTWREFVGGVGAVVISELLVPKAAAHALERGVRVVLIPNADWATWDGDTWKWLKKVKQLMAGSWGGGGHRGAEVWAKTPRFAGALAEHGITATLVPWCTLETVRRDAPPNRADEPVRFYASLGMGGWKGRRGADIILDAWAKLGATPEEATLTLKTIKPLSDQTKSPLPAEVVLIEELWTRDQVSSAYAEHDVTLYPTRWDGYGLSASESLDAGVPVLVPDAWPMCEHVRHGHNGLIFGADDKGKIRLAPKCEPSSTRLAEAMRSLIDDREQLERLTCPHPGERVAKQYAFRMTVRQLLLQEGAPRVGIVSMSGKGGDARRSEHYWRDALEGHGFTVDLIPKHEISSTAILAVDFLLVAKLTPDEMDQARRVSGGAPVVCWHHDLTDHTPGRAEWQAVVSQMADLSLIPEDDCQRFSGDVRTLMPGTKVGTQRPLGGLPQLRPDVVFLGSCTGREDERVERIENLLKGGATVRLFGHGWEDVNIEAGAYVADQKAWDEYAGALALCVSRGRGVRHYTSNRLFNAAGSGAVLVVQAFPGLEKLYPDGSAIVFQPGGVVEAVRSAHDDVNASAVMRAKSLAHTWRHHTWQDRISELLKMVAEKPRHGDVGGGEFAGMWEARAKRLGQRAVGHVGHTPAQHDKATEAWWRRLYRHLGNRLKSYDIKILDFGCGVGRFTQRLGAIDGKRVIGVDVSPEMVAMASAAHPQGDFRVCNPRRLPFPDDYFDVLWTCTVLQHIPDAELGAVVTELLRVCKSSAVALLYENTDQHGKRESRSGHVVFRREVEYRKLFQGVNEVETIEVLGETHSILAGRLG